jgi:hypothetical protein
VKIVGTTYGSGADGVADVDDAGGENVGAEPPRSTIVGSRAVPVSAGDTS